MCLTMPQRPANVKARKPKGMEKMIDQLPKDFTAAQRRSALQAQVADMHPRDLADAIVAVWPSKLGKAQALSLVLSIADRIGKFA